jgi:hypothetical protein
MTTMIGEVRKAQERAALIEKLEAMTPGAGNGKIHAGVLKALRHGPYEWSEYMKLNSMRDSLNKAGMQVGIMWMNGAREGDDFSWLMEAKTRSCDLCPAEVPIDQTKTFTEDGDEYEVCPKCYAEFKTPIALKKVQ